MKEGSSSEVRIHFYQPVSARLRIYSMEAFELFIIKKIYHHIPLVLIELITSKLFRPSPFLLILSILKKQFTYFNNFKRLLTSKYIIIIIDIFLFRRFSFSSLY
jgi:hypothetical protein